MDERRWKKIYSLFNDGLKLPSAERERFWKGECGADQDMLAELKRLLRGEEMARKVNLLDKPVWMLDEVNRYIGTENLVGRTVNGYQILESLGRGSMGEVYLAKKPPLTREVVIKTIVDASNDAFRKQFIEEMLVHEKIRHENIVMLLDAGSYGSLPYLVLEYFPSQSLRKFLRSPDRPNRQRSLPLDQVLRITRQIAAGLAYAHRAHGITHRDIKPENILVNVESSIKAKIIDFGIAILPELELGGQGRFFSRRYTYGASGTPLYMSPEQLKNVIAQQKVCSIDYRTDIYALGLVVYEMITGHSTFPSNGLRNYNRIIWPSKIRRDLPSAVDRVLKRALLDYPEARYQSVEQFYRDFDAALRPVLGGPRTGNTRKTGYWRRLTGILGRPWPRFLRGK